MNTWYEEIPGLDRQKERRDWIRQAMALRWTEKYPADLERQWDGILQTLFGLLTITPEELVRAYPLEKEKYADEVESCLSVFDQLGWTSPLGEGAPDYFLHYPHRVVKGFAAELFYLFLQIARERGDE